MSMPDFQQLMAQEEYDFLRKNEHLGRRIMLLGLSGSYGYGTNREGSDVDFRGVALQQPSDILGLTEFEQYVDDHTDTVIFGFNKLVKLLLEKKKRTTEGEFNPHIPEVQGFIREELPKQKAICDAMPDDRNKDWSPLNRCFAEIIGVEAGKPE